MKEYIIFIANYWGTSSGGISTFNYDLTRAIAKRRSERGQVTVCLLLHSISDVEKKAVKDEFGLKLISLLKDDDETYEGVTETPPFLKNLKKMVGFKNDDELIWVGHDIKTGNYANLCRNEYGGKSLVFNHMNYSEYYYLATGDEEKEAEKEALQRNVLQCADWVCAIGPVLRDYSEDVRHEADKNDVTEFIPGMLEITPTTALPNTFKILFFGRIDQKNNYIKQPRLAIAAFAQAYENDRKNQREIFKNNPRMEVYGYNDINNDDKKILKDLIHEYTSETLNITPRKYLEDRDRLMRVLRSSSLCIMISRHEGFGLAAYEALSAGVPIIISDNSGLDRFLKSKRGKEVQMLYKSVHIEGTLTEEGYPSQADLETVSKAILEVLGHYSESKKNALKLREILLEEQYTWDNQAGILMNLIHNLQEKKSEVLEEVPANIWERDVEHTDLNNYLTYQFLPDMCNLLLGGAPGDYLHYVQSVLVRFDEKRGVRQTLVVAGKGAHNSGKARILDEGVVGMMIEQNTESNPETTIQEAKPVFYDFSKDVSYVSQDGTIVEFKPQRSPGGQDKNVRAILAFPLVHNKRLEGAVTLDFYNLAQLKLDDSLEKLTTIMKQGMICMRYLDAVIFNNYNEELEDN